jgi:hypothetical protein
MGTNCLLSISYEPSDRKALFRYAITEGTQGLSYELRSDENLIAAGRLQGLRSLAQTAKELFEDFSSSSTNSQTMFPGSGAMKSIRIVYRCGIFEHTASITASDETLVAFMSRSYQVRKLFSELSQDKPKMYRLWDDPGPLKAHMPNKQRK